MTASIIDAKTLGEVVGYSMLGGVGVCVVFALAVSCATRSGDSRRDGRRTFAGLYAALAALALACAAAAVVYGIVLTTQKT